MFERLRHPFSARHVQLLAREYISPNFIRLTLGGPDMAGFKSLGFDDHVKLILPQAGQQKPNLPYLVDEKPQVDEPRPIMRDYTPLNYDERLNTIELDFACADPRDQRAWALGEQVDMRYVPTLDGVLDTLSLGAGTGFIWGAGEHNQMAALRTALLEQGLHARQMHLSAYWRAED